MEPYHILHFVGHGAFTDEGEAILLLSDETGQTKEARANAIAQLIGGQKALQLVVLNSCDGARTKLDDPFAGIATILVQQGNSAVIAMQFEITDAAAKTFAEELYYCLIDRRYPIDAAVAEARKAMMGINQIEFATPVLFLRPGTADLFHFVGPAGRCSSRSQTLLPPPAGHRRPPRSTFRRDHRSEDRSGLGGWSAQASGSLSAVAAVVAVVALSSGGDDPDEAAELVAPRRRRRDDRGRREPGTDPIGRDVVPRDPGLSQSALFREPYFDAADPELFYVGIDLCDEALIQLEADGLEADPLYAEIDDRLDDADILSSFVDDGTDTPADHQAFADSGEGLYEQTYPMLRTLRGLDPSPEFFADELEEEVADETDRRGSRRRRSAATQTLTDDTGVLTVDVPIEWDDIDTESYTFDDGTESPWIVASPSIAEYDSTYTDAGAVLHCPRTRAIARRDPCRVRPGRRRVHRCRDRGLQRRALHGSLPGVHGLRRHGHRVRHGRRGAGRQLVHGHRRDAARVRRRSGSARPGVRDVHRDALNELGVATG